jgi:hypothetical protein
MDERDTEREEPVRHETTIINAGGERGGGGATMLALIVALLVGVGAFLYFGGYLGGGRADRDININIKAPDINITPPGGGNSS